MEGNFNRILSRTRRKGGAMKYLLSMVLATVLVYGGCGDDSDSDCDMEDCGVGSCEPGFHLHFDEMSFHFAPEEVSCYMESEGCIYYLIEIFGYIESSETFMEIYYIFEEGSEEGEVWVWDENEYGDIAIFDCYYYYEKADGTFSGNFTGMLGEDGTGPSFSGCFKDIGDTDSDTDTNTDAEQNCPGGADCIMCVPDPRQEVRRGGEGDQPR